MHLLFRALIFTLFAILVTSSKSFCQQHDRRLEKELQEMIKGFNGEIGIYVKDLRKNRITAINADTVFPTASIVKVPIMVGVMKKISDGSLQYGQELIYKDSLLYAGVDILGSFKNNEKVSLKNVLMLMLTTSDNTASLWLQSLAGGGLRINQLMDSLGFKNTLVNSRTPGRRPIWEIYGWGQTTPREMAGLVERIYNYNLFSDSASERMMRLLGRNYWDETSAISQVPPTIEVFSKNGAVDASRSEVLLVNAPGRPYILSIFTKNNKDQSWAMQNEAWVLARKISLHLWNYYKPANRLVSLRKH